MSNPGDPRTAAAYEARIRAYFDACNQGDAAEIASHFVPQGTHYFPPGMYEGPFRGGATIGRRWREAVERFGSIWTVDNVIVDAPRHVAVIEWTHFKTKVGTVLRGDEWYEFDAASGRIREIRAYYASPQAQDLERLELGGFDYVGRGYPDAPPAVTRAGDPEAQ
jgi:hypothetical protein